MSLRKFISGVCAFAVAVTAFAAVAVTASAMDYGPIDVTPVAQNNMTNNGNGTFTSASGASSSYALALADFSDLTDIDKATTITLDFKTAIPTSGRFVFCLGDKSKRGTNAAGSIGTNFKFDGVAMFFGSLDGKSYKVNNSGNALSAFQKTVKAHIVINKNAGKLSYRLTDTSNTVLAENTTGIAPYNNKAKTVDVIEAYTWRDNVTAQFTGVTVSYTVPTAPTAGTPEPVDLGETTTGDGVYAKAYTCDIDYDGIAIQNVKVEVEGANEPSQKLSFNGGYSGDVRIGIILASKDSSKINVEPKVKVNVQ